ncbi:unnamed protein product [Diplocarpon coronariae]
MAPGNLLATADVNRIEAPVTFKAYLMCTFASFGGIFFGFDSAYISGLILQTASSAPGLFVAGRLIAGSSERHYHVHGAIVFGYQICITIGILLASYVNYRTQNRMDTGSYHIPIALQMLWALILSIAIFLQESPRYHVKSNLEMENHALIRLHREEEGSQITRQVLAEFSWADYLTGSVFKRSSNFHRTILCTSLQTGINFIFYFGTTFFKELDTISNPFLIGLITTLVNVCSTPISFFIIEKFGRRNILICGAWGMLICEFIVGVVGVSATRESQDNNSAVSAQIDFICIYVFFFATTWGPAAWVLIGEIFSLPIRSRGVALSTASNWLWNCIIAVITPCMVEKHKGEANTGSKVLSVWGSLCTACFFYAIFLVPETKGLSLEQVDRMLEETTPMNSAK